MPEATAPDINPAYLAGVFDGEGTVTFWESSSGQSVMQIAVAMSHQATVELFAQAFGGKVHAYKNTNGGQMHRWNVQGVRCQEALRALHPYLLTKKEQAEVALAFLTTICKPGQRLTDREQLYRHRLVGMLRELNTPERVKKHG
jgi:hypothetical protein